MHQFQAELSRDDYHWELARWNENGPVEVIVIVDETHAEDDRMRVSIQIYDSLDSYCCELSYSKIDFAEETIGSKLIQQALTELLDIRGRDDGEPPWAGDGEHLSPWEDSQEP